MEGAELGVNLEELEREAEGKYHQTIYKIFNALKNNKNTSQWERLKGGLEGRNEGGKYVISF